MPTNLNDSEKKNLAYVIGIAKRAKEFIKLLDIHKF
jgi:hypothetical protein